MHDQWRDDFDAALGGMGDAEKAELIDRISRSMCVNGSERLRTPQDVARRLAQIAALPEQSPPDGFSARDHDAVLYGSPRDHDSK